MPSSTRKRFKASPRPAAKRIMDWWTWSSTVDPGCGSLQFGPLDVLGRVGFLERGEEGELGVLLLGLLLRRCGFRGVLAEEILGPFRDGEQSGLVALHLDDARDLLQVDAEPLGNLPGRVEL